MQAYARAKLAPAEPEFYDQPIRRHPYAAAANQLAADRTAELEERASGALAALLLGGLDEDALGALAKRLVPHLSQLENLKREVRHLAYTVDTLAAELGMSPKAIRCAIARGELRGVKRGSRWIISADAVDEWASTPEPRRSTRRRCAASAPKGAGPSLRSVLCDGTRGGER
jgi:excisionase family DNA binding protein